MASICVFGSVARGRMDALSDKDVLIISDDGDVSRLALPWLRQNWSVTDMTEMRFTGLRLFGSLFIEHIRKEGLLIRDDNDFLKVELSHPVKSFIDEQSFTSDIDFICSLNNRRMSSWAALCYADICYCIIRNAGVNICALRANPKFGFDDIIDEISAGVDISIFELKALRQLRWLKTCYRRRYSAPDCRNLVGAAVTGATKIFRSFERKKDTHCARNGYQRLRFAEISLVNVIDPMVLDNMKYTSPLYEIWQLIRNPNDYPVIKSIDQTWVDGALALANVTPFTSSMGCRAA